MDIFNDFDSEDLSVSGAKMVLTNPKTGFDLTAEKEGHEEPQPMYLMMKGIDSPDVVRIRSKLEAMNARRKPGVQQSNDEIEAEKIRDCKLLRSITTGGEVADKDGKWVSVDGDIAYRLFLGAAAFRSQALTFMMTRSNFIKG